MKILINNELTQINWDIITLDTHQDIGKMFSMSYNKCNRLVNKHAPLKTLSGRKVKLFSKPCHDPVLRYGVMIILPENIKTSVSSNLRSGSIFVSL